MNLKESDYKLLSYLYHNSREPLSKIAKACKLSREQVDYKIKKYISSGLIRSFFTYFDWSKFGYDHLIFILVKLEKPSSIKPFLTELKKSKNCLSAGKVFNKYDVYMNCIFKSENELGEYITKLISDSENPISHYQIIKPYLTELYPVKFFKHKQHQTITYPTHNVKGKKFDDKEMQIMKILSQDARARIIDIAKKINISAELVIYKINKLKKEKVIVGSQIQFNMSKLGYHFSIIELNIKNFSKTIQEKIKRFAFESKHINTLNFMLGKPNCIIQVFHKEESELRETIEQIKELLKDQFFDLEVILIGDDEENVNSLPFYS